MGMWIQNYIIGAFKPPCDISITFSDARTRKQVQCLYPHVAAVGFHTGILLIAYKLLVSAVVISQVSVKKDNGKTTMVPVFQSLETISGEVWFPCFLVLTYLAWVMPSIQLRWNGFQVSIAPVPGKRIEHMGVKIELLGQIGMLSQLLLVLQHVNYVTMVLLLEIPWSLLSLDTWILHKIGPNVSLHIVS